MRIAAIDQGTTSTRVLLVDTQGRREVLHAVEHQQHYPQPGWVEHEPLELLDNVRQCIQRAGAVDYIGLSNQGESCLAWDAVTREPLSRVIVWQDNRTEHRISELKSRGAEVDTLALAGLPLDSYFSASKLAWLLENNPLVAQAQAEGRLRLGTTDSYFLDCLSGSYMTDMATASRTSLMNLETGQWDEQLCALFAVPMDLLPQIVPSTGLHFGQCQTAQGARPVLASIVDQQAALYGSGCRHSGDLKFTFGTGGFALAVTDSCIHRPSSGGLLPTVAWQKADEAPVFALDGGIYTASAALNWARSLGLFEDYAQVGSFSRIAAIDRDIVFVPALSGLACPHWDRQAKGAWLGLGMESERSDLVQAIIESIAFRAAEVVAAMGDCFTLPASIGVDGGLSKNPYFVQFLADVLEMDVRPARFPEMTALGVATLVADTVGVSLPEVNDYGSCAPAKNRRVALQRFKQAVEISRQWKQSQGA